MLPRTVAIAGLLLLIAGGAFLWKWTDAGEARSIPAGQREPAKAKSSERDEQALESGREALRKIRGAAKEKSPEAALDGMRELTLLHEKAVQEQLDLMIRMDKQDSGGKARLEAVNARIGMLRNRILEAGEPLKQAGTDRAAIDALLDEHNKRLGRIAAISELQAEERLSR